MSAVLKQRDPTGYAMPSESLSNSWLLVQSFHLLRLKFEPALKPIGLTGLQLTILIMLKKRAGISSADLARRFYKSPQGMGQLLNALADREMIERAEHPENRRILQVTLTDKGRKAVAAGEAAMRRVERETFGHLDPELLIAMRAALHDLGSPQRQKK